MLSDSARQALEARLALSDEGASRGLSPAHIAALVPQVNAQTLNLNSARDPSLTHVVDHRSNAGALNDITSQFQGMTFSTAPEPPVDDTGELRASIVSDLRKHSEGKSGDDSMPDLSWSQIMQIEGKTLQDMIFDPAIPTQTVASALSAKLVTRFPGTDLRSYFTKNLHPDVAEVQFEMWRLTALGYAIYYRTNKKNPSPEQLAEYMNNRVPVESIAKYFGDPEFDVILTELGITAPHLGLSEKQMLSLSLISSFTDARPLSTKLRSIGVKDWEFNNWLGYPKFGAAYRKITEDQLNEVQPVINTALIQLATGTGPGSSNRPDLAAIKYIQEMNGRWDPQSRQVMDIRSFMTRVVDILSSELADDPVKLQRIGTRLVSAAQLLNGTTNLQIEGNLDQVSGPEPASIKVTEPISAFGL